MSTTTSVIVVLVFIAISLYQHWKINQLENVFLMVLLKLNGVDVDGTSNRE